MNRIRDYYTAQAAAQEIGIQYKALLMRITRGRVHAETVGKMKLIPVREVRRLKALEEQRRRERGA